MARNLSWIDKRKLNSLLDDEDEERTEAPERPRGLLDDEAEPAAPPSRFEARRGRFDEPPRRARFDEPPPRVDGPPASFLGELPEPPPEVGLDEPPAPPPFPEPAGGWRPEPEDFSEPPTPPPLGEALSEVTEELPADDGAFALPHDENVLETSDNPDLEGFADALDALPLEAFATSGPSSFDLPPSAEPAARPAARPRARPQAAAIVDEAAMFNPFDQSPATDPGLAVPDPLARDDSTTDAPVEDDPESAFEAAFAGEGGPPPPIEDLELPASSFEVTAPATDDLPDAPPPIEDISLPGAELLNPTLDFENPPDGFTPGEPEPASYTLDVEEPTGATGETGTHDDDELGFAPPPPERSPPPTTRASEPPPPIAGEAIELTCERFFDWALDHVGLDGALVVDRDGLLISERGFHELHPALLAEALPLARGLVRLQGARPCGHLYLERGRLHVVVVWCLQEGRSFVAGLSGLAPPQSFEGLDEAFRALFGGEP